MIACRHEHTHLGCIGDPGFLRPGLPRRSRRWSALRGPVRQGSHRVRGLEARQSCRHLRPQRPGQPGKTGRPGLGSGVHALRFLYQHAAELHLAPLAQADVVGVSTQERWTLVGKAGGPVSGPASMTGYTILSGAGYAPEFVKHSALAAWAPLPADIKIEATGQILSALRRVASGEPVLALLDQTQAAALVTLPFAAQLKTLTQSTPLPVALITVVDSRLPDPRAKAFQTALIKLNSSSGGAEMLASLKLKGFVLPQLPGNAGKP